MKAVPYTEADVLRAIDSCGGTHPDPNGDYAKGYNDALEAAQQEVTRLFARNALPALMDENAALRARCDALAGLLERVWFSAVGPQVGAGDGGTVIIQPLSGAVLKDISAALAHQRGEQGQ